MAKADALKRCGRAAGWFLLGALAFGLAYAQAPLYYSNQNQYFLHGLAQAGQGPLRDDWLANTQDPTPVFSLLVTATANYLHEYAFYVYYVLLLGVYLASMLGLFTLLAGARATPRLCLAFLALFLLVHSALARWCSYRWLGLDYPWYFQAGVAGQYILGAMFQPSAFGVLLLLALVLFVKDRPFLAAACACLAATVHSTYLLGAAILILAFMIDLAVRGRTRQALGLGLWSLALVLPVLTYVLVAFRPSSGATFAQAQHLLVQVRIPHHAIPRLWCDPIALGQAAWIVLALVLVRRTRLFVVLTVTFLLSLGLTLLQVGTDSNTLALLFPWRTSALLVPVATTIILSRLVTACARWLEKPPAVAVNAVVLAAVVVAGIVIMQGRLGFQSADEELPMMDFVRSTCSGEDVYLLPVQVPKLAATTRGSLSSDFKPLADKKKDARIIPVDFQRFRLYTGARIYVDFKAIPYQDTDVLDWHARLEWNQKLYERLRAGELGPALAELRRRGITHVVMIADQDQKLREAGLREVYGDRFYRIYPVPKAESPGEP